MNVSLFVTYIIRRKKRKTRFRCTTINYHRALAHRYDPSGVLKFASKDNRRTIKTSVVKRNVIATRGRLCAYSIISITQIHTSILSSKYCASLYYDKLDYRFVSRKLSFLSVINTITIGGRCYSVT